MKEWEELLVCKGEEDDATAKAIKAPEPLRS